MRAAVYLGGEKNIRVQEVPSPVLAEGEALIKIGVCNICGVDLRTYEHGDMKIEPPRILGHEMSGTVVDIRSDLKSIDIGDRVIVYAVLSCGKCIYCVKRKPNLCDHRTTISYQYDGAFAEYMVVPAQAVHNNQIIRIPESLTFEEAALAEPLGCVLNSHQRLNIGIGDTVIVIGAGPIGILHCLISKIEGAGHVSLMDISHERLALAEQFEFDSYIHIDGKGEHIHTVRSLNDNLGPNVVIVACASPQAQADALEMASKEARIDFFGGLKKSNPFARLNTNLIHYKQLVLTGSFSQRIDDFTRALNIISGQSFPAKKLITHEFELEDILKAFEMIKSGSAIKVAIKPNV